MTLIEVLKNIDGAATARRVGTDALTPTFAKLLPMAFPNAELVDGELAMRAARRIKTADEIAALRGGPAGRRGWPGDRGGRTARRASPNRRWPE